MLQKCLCYHQKLLIPNNLPQFMTGEDADINSTLDDNKTLIK